MRNGFKRLGLVIMLLTITTLIIPLTTYANLTQTQDADVPSAWAEDGVNKAKEMELLPQRIQGDYRNIITREELSELVVNLYEVLIRQEVTLPETSPFTDTQNRKVAMASQLGIVNGKGNGIFAPYEGITREQLSVMFYRTLQAARPKYNFSEKYEHEFSDYGMIASWAREAVGYLYGVEIINGVGDNQFNPAGTTTREEAVVLAVRMYDKVLEADRASKSTLTVTRGSIRKPESDIKVKLKELIAKEMGKPYKYGAAGPNSFDCSGLIYSIYGRLGISLPRTSRTQATAGTYVAKSDLAYGDLVFFARDGKNINHAGIYVGNGEFVHAPQTGDVVKVTTLMSGYYANGYYTARRVLP